MPSRRKFNKRALRKPSSRRVATIHRKQSGQGLINWLISNLPTELHIPGYSFCGPGTKLQQRLAAGERGINRLDTECLKHDLAYEKHSDTPNRLRADRELEIGAQKISDDPNTQLGEKLAAKFVIKIMRLKQALKA